MNDLLDEAYETYRKQHDANFSRVDVRPPTRLNQKYFCKDGKGKPILDNITGKLIILWQQLAAQILIEELYIFGTQATGKFHEDYSDLDVAILCHVPYSEAQELGTKLGAKVLRIGFEEAKEIFALKKAGNQSEAKKLLESAKRDYVADDNEPLFEGNEMNHPQVHVIKPYGIVYDLKNKKWFSFEKSQEDHERILDEVDPIRRMIG